MTMNAVPHHAARPPVRRQPLGPTRALIVVLGLFVVLAALLGPGLSLFFRWFAHRVPTDSWLPIAITLVIVGLALVHLALGVTSLVLAIIVLVQGRGHLRTGAILALIAVVGGTLAGVEVTGDIGTAADVIQQAAGVLAILSTIVQVVMVIVGVLGVVFLVLGHRESTREQRRRLSV